MDPEQIQREMKSTRASIDRTLDRLEDRVHQAKDRTVSWIPLAAIGAGMMGMLAFWPRQKQAG